LIAVSAVAGQELRGSLQGNLTSSVSRSLAGVPSDASCSAHEGCRHLSGSCSPTMATA